MILTSIVQPVVSVFKKQSHSCEWGIYDSTIILYFLITNIQQFCEISKLFLKKLKNKKK